MRPVDASFACFVITYRRFGFTNLQSAREGKPWSECRGEEHEIVLIWSVVSGKVRVFWNSSNISHLFPQRRYAEKVDISWQSRSGERFRIAASESSNVFGPQYDFLIDDTSIFSLNHLSELGSVVLVEDRMDTSVRSESENGTLSEGTIQYDDVPTQNLGFRLSMAGFTPSSEPQDSLEDDLTPTSVTNVLESIRRLVTELIPNSEDMVSRAIINALSEHQFETSCSWESSSSLESSTPTGLQIEADAILDTADWINLNVKYAPRPDVEYQKRAFMQKQMATIFMNVRQGRQEEASAARTLNNIAALLGVTTNETIPRDTLILKELDKGTVAETIVVALCEFGEIREVAIATGHRGGKWVEGRIVVHPNLPHHVFVVSILSALPVRIRNWSSASTGRSRARDTFHSRETTQGVPP